MSHSVRRIARVQSGPSLKAALGVAVFAAAVALSTPASAQIVNGGFETGDFAGWTVTSTNANPAVVGVNTAPGNFYGVPQSNIPDGGTRFASFGGGDNPANAVLSQTFATTSGQQYSLQFSYGNWGNGNPQSLRVIVTDPTTNGTLFTTDIIDTTATTNGASPTLFTPYNFAFTAASAQATLTLQDITVNSSSADALLDAVQVSAIGAVAAPEPGTLALASLGLLSAGLLTLRRHRRCCRSRNTE